MRRSWGGRHKLTARPPRRGYNAAVMPTSIHQLTDLLERRFGVDALWLFGSQATGHARADSDVDVAVLFRERPALLDLLDARAEAALLLGRDVDLVDLERASPILAMQVLRHGRLLVDNNPSHRHRFTAGAPGRYEDLKRVRRPIERRLLQRVLHGRP